MGGREKSPLSINLMGRGRDPLPSCEKKEGRSGKKVRLLPSGEEVLPASIKRCSIPSGAVVQRVRGGFLRLGDRC